MDRMNYLFNSRLHRTEFSESEIYGDDLYQRIENHYIVHRKESTAEDQAVTVTYGKQWVFALSLIILVLIAAGCGS